MSELRCKDVEEVKKLRYLLNDLYFNFPMSSGKFTDCNGVKIEFDRASGACKKMAGGVYCYGFKVTCGKTTYIVNLEPLTGKATIQ